MYYWQEDSSKKIKYEFKRTDMKDGVLRDICKY